MQSALGNTLKSLFIDGIGILGPGLNGWPLSQPILAGEKFLEKEDVAPPMSNILSSNEQRRASETVKWAMHVAKEAIDHSKVKPQEIATVFASSDGDGMILHKLCSALTAPRPHISPTLFHHSVHNAPAGYWGIAYGSQLSSTSISCHDGTFSGGLLETATQVTIEGLPTLLVTYDIPAPSPLYEARPISKPFGIALLIRSKPSPQSLVELEVSQLFNSVEHITTLKDKKLETCRIGVPTARGLPLLTSIARHRPDTVVLEYLDNIQLQVKLVPCP